MNSLFDLSGKRALITGSSQGIGLAIAKALHLAGAEIILNGRNEDKLKQVAQSLSKGNDVPKVSFAAFDVSDVKAVKDTIEGLGQIDILVNNTGMTIRGALLDFAPVDWQAVMHTNVDSMFYVSQAVAGSMIARGAGKIINICSVQSELGRPSIVPYTASKGAVKMLTKGMCAEWAKYGLQINGIAPGYFVTELTQKLVDDPSFNAWLCQRTPANRWGQVDELGGAAVFLASAASSYVNGHILAVDGGMTAAV
ncbi:MAG: Gluconate 5-dehydrogenase [Pseudomonadota bacterium]|jgi:gluconate 5-dehydrogenase